MIPEKYIHRTVDGKAVQVKRSFDTDRQVSRFMDRLYDQFNSVQLVRSPSFSFSGEYVWNVSE